MSVTFQRVSFDDTAAAFSFRDDRELKRIYWLFWLMNLGWLTHLAKYLIPVVIRLHLPVKKWIRNTLYQQFCGGETLEDVMQTAKRLDNAGMHIILDYGVEGKETEEVFEHTCAEYIRMITYAARESNIPFIAVKMTGLARTQLLEKLHAQHTLSEAEETEWQRACQRLERIVKEAVQHHIGVMVDAEESWIQSPIDEWVMKLMQTYNQQTAVLFQTYQLYRTDRLALLKSHVHQAKENGFILGAKLVRGAYLEKERKRAAEKGYPSPVHASKTATDQDYNEAIQYCMNYLDHVSCCIATHNENSCQLTIQLMEEKQIPPHHPHVCFSQLYGMSDHISFNLSKHGYRVCKYLPYGPLEDVIPYLMRRAQENTSVAGQTSRELRLIKQEIARRKAMQLVR
ncbi:proline dehydrogenase family protein [Thermoflavifilum thermophilum]|uniref:L-proline dehydrogenase n=1 Tax=Thermoflavifilum thermophilum TaxID=1393122 RepID=A0A1I7NLC1_9BACT|nr:proline dehydrogenase family protein [Thermoflavifilum thermophilum]SFV35481.1 L-proline dehydrogenase [Thermoflavifilum thermophilum]